MLVTQGYGQGAAIATQGYGANITTAAVIAYMVSIVLTLYGTIGDPFDLFIHALAKRDRFRTQAQR